MLLISNTRQSKEKKAVSIYLLKQMVILNSYFTPKKQQEEDTELKNKFTIFPS